MRIYRNEIFVNVKYKKILRIVRYKNVQKWKKKRKIINLDDPDLVLPEIEMSEERQLKQKILKRKYTARNGYWKKLQIWKLKWKMSILKIQVTQIK